MSAPFSLCVAPNPADTNPTPSAFYIAPPGPTITINALVLNGSSFGFIGIPSTKFSRKGALYRVSGSVLLNNLTFSGTPNGAINIGGYYPSVTNPMVSYGLYTTSTTSFNVANTPGLPFSMYFIYDGIASSIYVVSLFNNTGTAILSGGSIVVQGLIVEEVTSAPTSGIS